MKNIYNVIYILQFECLFNIECSKNFGGKKNPIMYSDGRY